MPPEKAQRLINAADIPTREIDGANTIRMQIVYEFSSTSFGRGYFLYIDAVNIDGKKVRYLRLPVLKDVACNKANTDKAMKLFRRLKARHLKNAIGRFKEMQENMEIA